MGESYGLLVQCFSAGVLVRPLFRMRTAAGIFTILLLAGPTARAESCDASKPVLTGFTLSPQSVDVTSAARTVTCRMTFSKTGLAPITHAECRLAPQSGTGPAYLSCAAEFPATGDAWNGTFACDIGIPRRSVPGPWVVDAVFALDSVGHAVVHNYLDLPLLGFDSSITVVDATPATSGPGFEAVGFWPTALDLTSGNGLVTCSMVVHDAFAEVTALECRLISDLVMGRSCVVGPPVPLDVPLTCSIVVPQHEPPGVWNVQVYARDALGNTNLAAPGTVSVTSVADSTPPVVTAFDLQPQAVDPKGGPGLPRCVIQATDDMTGVNGVDCAIASDSSALEWACHSDTRDADGAFSCLVPIPLSSPSGPWHVTYVGAMDGIGNDTGLSTAELAARGFPTTLEVSCSSDPENSLYFRDKTTLAWHVAVSRTRQNTYRGSCRDLVDADHDGLPDKGYGTCQNSRDPNLTDNVFADTGVPSRGDCYFYVVSYGNAGVEKGLGFTSADVARHVVASCP